MMIMEKILVADDEQSIANLIAYAFEKEGYSVEIAYDGEEALDKITKYKPKILIIDVMMPELNGFQVLKKLKNENKLGIIMLTAKNDMADKILGLELGADDYITKPFDIRELIARARSLIRRLSKANENFNLDEIKIRDLVIILNQRKVLLKDVELDFTPKEFDLLVLLISHVNHVYTRDDILDKIWGIEYIGGTRTVDIHVQRIRKKLGMIYSETIQTVHGVGYKAVEGSYEN